jgi:hypothetical protein
MSKIKDLLEQGYDHIPVFLKNEQWEDGDGLKHKLFAVRSMGKGRGYGILDTYANAFVLFSIGVSREEAKKVLETATVDDHDRWRQWIRDTIKQQGITLANPPLTLGVNPSSQP